MAADKLANVIGASAVGTGLATAGIAAAVPLAIRGITALTPQAREERKRTRRALKEAEDAVKKGEKYGFGPGARRRQAMVAQRMRDYKAQTADTRDTMQRQQSVLGLGRSGIMAGQQAALAKQDADYLGRVRAGVEDEARDIGLYRERQARFNLAQQQGLASQRAAEQRQFFAGVGQQAVTSGLAAGLAKQQSMTADTLDPGELAENKEQATGEAPTARTGIRDRFRNRKDDPFKGRDPIDPETGTSR